MTKTMNLGNMCFRRVFSSVFSERLGEFRLHEQTNEQTHGQGAARTTKTTRHPQQKHFLEILFFQNPFPLSANGCCSGMMETCLCCHICQFACMGNVSGTFNVTIIFLSTFHPMLRKVFFC